MPEPFTGIMLTLITVYLLLTSLKPVRSFLDETDWFLLVALFAGLFLAALTLLWTRDVGLVLRITGHELVARLLYILIGVVAFAGFFFMSAIHLEADAGRIIGWILFFLSTGALVLWLAVGVVNPDNPSFWIGLKAVGVVLLIIVALAFAACTLPFAAVIALVDITLLDGALGGDQVMRIASACGLIPFLYFLYRFARFLTPRGRAAFVDDEYIDLDRVQPHLREVIKEATGGTNRRPWLRLWLLGDDRQLTRQDVEQLVETACYEEKLVERYYSPKDDAARQRLIAQGSQKIAAEVNGLSDDVVRHLDQNGGWHE